MEHAVDLGFRLENHLRIARVTAQIGGHPGSRSEQMREQTAIRRQQRILLVENVQLHGAVIRVDGRFHRVADVVEGSQALVGNGPRVGVRIGRHVAVHDPDQMARVAENHVRIGVPRDKTGQLAQTFRDVPVDHHAALRREVAGEQDIPVAARDRGQGAQPQRRDREPAAPVVTHQHVAGAGGVVELLLRGADKHGVVHLFAVINLRASEFQLRNGDHGRRVLDEQHGEAGGCDAVGLGHYHAVAVRVHEVGGNPTALRVAQRFEIQLARRYEDLALLAVDVVAVHVGIGIHIGPQRLHLRNGFMEGVPVPEADVVQQRLVCGQIDALLRPGLKVHFAGAPVEREGRTRRFDMAHDERPLQ